MTDYGKRGRRKCLYHNGNYFCTLKEESCRGVCDEFEFKPTNMTAEKKNKLITFWETKTDSLKASRAAKSLRRQAEIDVAKAQEDMENAKNKFDEEKMNAKDDTKEGFKKIVKAYMAMQVEQKKFDDAILIYEALFEEKPRLLD